MKKKVMKAQMDSQIGISYQPESRPEVANLIRIFAAISGETIESVCLRFAAAGNAHFKDSLADLLIDHFRPIQANLARLKEDPAAIQSVLEEGGRQANRIAYANVRELHSLMGLAPLPEEN